MWLSCHYSVGSYSCVPLPTPIVPSSIQEQINLSFSWISIILFLWRDWKKRRIHIRPILGLLSSLSETCKDGTTLKQLHPRSGALPTICLWITLLWFWGNACTWSYIRPLFLIYRALLIIIPLVCYWPRISLLDNSFALFYPISDDWSQKMIVSPVLALALSLSATSAFAGPVQKPDIRLPSSAAMNKAAVVDIFTRSYNAYKWACFSTFMNDSFD